MGPSGGDYFMKVEPPWRDYRLYKEKHKSTCSFFLCKDTRILPPRNQGESSHQAPDLPAPWFWTSQLPECGRLFQSSSLKYFYDSSLNWLRQLLNHSSPVPLSPCCSFLTPVFPNTLRLLQRLSLYSRKAPAGAQACSLTPMYVGHFVGPQLSGQ